MNFQRTPGTVFVTVPDPTPIVSPSPEAYERSWEQIAQRLAFETSAPKTEADTPSIDAVFAESLPLFIEASRWGRYIIPGPASRIHDNRVFVYHNPCDGFWDLYDLAKGIFRDLGIRVSKERETWIARIPIRILTDKVFITSGLAAVEQTLLAHTGIDPIEILAEIRQRQFQETQDGYRNVKLRQRETLGDAVGDAVGAIVIFAVSYFGFVVGGM